MNQLLKKFKEIIFGSKEWKESVSKVAVMLDVVDKSMWAIGDIAKKIPKDQSLRKFAKEVSEKTKRFKNFHSAYNTIWEARRISSNFDIEERVEDLPVAHHKVALKLIPDKKERHEKLLEAKEKGLTADEFYEEVVPTREPIILDKIGKIMSKGESYGRALREFLEEDFDNLTPTQNEMLQRDMAITFKEDIIPFLKKLYRKKGKIIFEMN